MWGELFSTSITIVCLISDVFLKLLKYIKFQYKFWFFYVYTITLCTILIPVLMFRPKDSRNGLLVTRGMYLITNILGLKWHIRNSNVLLEQRAAVIIANHQSTIDILGMHNVWKKAYKCIVVSKREMIYTLTCGLCMYLCDAIFLDRKRPKEAFKELQMKADKTFKKKTKVFIFPEGTRNEDLTKLLKFKKGAFAIAIASQVPLIPVVVSPYYFINRKRQLFNQGNIILQCLEPIETEGLTMDDLPDLMERTYNIMNRTYNELFLEVTKTLPPNYPIAIED